MTDAEQEPPTLWIFAQLTDSPCQSQAPSYERHASAARPAWVMPAQFCQLVAGHSTPHRFVKELDGSDWDYRWGDAVPTEGPKVKHIFRGEARRD